jgi:hypothetical protein
MATKQGGSMQASQIRERFSEVEQCIHNAAEVCEMSSDVPERVRDCVTQLEQQSSRALEIAMQKAEDPDQVRQCLTDLEKIGDRALQACSQAEYVDATLQNAVRQARKAISSFKQQVH